MIGIDKTNMTELLWHNKFEWLSYYYQAEKNSLFENTLQEENLL